MAYSYDEMEGSPQNPDDHPEDSGHNAEHQTGRDMLEDAKNRNQSLQFKDSVRATRDAYKAGKYDSTGTYKGN